MKIRLAVLVAGVLAAISASGQEYPSRPIRWIVPFLAGTSPDLTARIVAEAMGQILHQPVVVDNRAGAAGNIGAQTVARSPKDGYTWIYSTSQMAASMRMYGKPGFSATKDFDHIGRITSSDLVLVTNRDSGFGNLTSLLQSAQAKSGSLTYASGGTGSPAHLGSELILNLAKMQALHVPYKGGSESVNAVLGKQVDFALTVIAASLNQINGGKLTALAVTGPTRNPRLPDVPTMKEAGLPGIEITNFGGLSVPAGTRPDIELRIRQALSQALADPAVKAKLESTGASVAPSTSAEYAADFVHEITQTEKMMAISKIEPQ